jgi:hypothetical protein
LKRASLGLGAAAVLLFAVGGAPPSPDESSIIKRFVELYGSSHFDEAARLLHCPPEYTAAELDTDLSNVAVSLRIMSELYGPIHSSSVTTDGALYVTSSAACGTTAYWKDHPPIGIQVLTTEQRDSEQGYMTFQFSRVGATTVLFQFGHGLPASNPEALSRAQSFVARKLAK